MPGKVKDDVETKVNNNNNNNNSNNAHVDVSVVHTDMDVELQNFVKTAAIRAMKGFEKGELQ